MPCFPNIIRTFFEEWKNTYTPEWLQEFPQSHFHNEFNRVNEAKKLKDARLLYTALTKQLYTRYARIYHYLDLLKHVETSDGISIETDSTRIANNSRKQIRVNLKQILCEIYAYLTVNDSNFQIQSIIDHNNVNITRNADNDKEDIFSGIVYVDLIHTLNNFYHFTKTFVEMH
uniref:(northern house mosquito) hypothetical protein n=1 Tax=Culex pipiens TaxID=7175 RepID=A0A8D8B1R7_CULPI